MAESTAQARGAQRFSAAVSRGLRESAVIALAVVGLVLLVALATYSPADPGWSQVTDSTGIHNRIGPVGAWLANLLFFIFGRPAYLFPAMIALVTWTLFRSGRREAALAGQHRSAGRGLRAAAGRQLRARDAALVRRRACPITTAAPAVRSVTWWATA